MFGQLNTASLLLHGVMMSSPNVEDMGCGVVPESHESWVHVRLDRPITLRRYLDSRWTGHASQERPIFSATSAAEKFKPQHGTWLVAPHFLFPESIPPLHPTSKADLPQAG